MVVSRRSVLIGAAVGGGLVLGWGMMPRSYSNPLAAGRDEVAFDAWLKIGLDGVVTVALPQLEMGQGISTLLPQIIAEEMGADWRQMALEPAPASGAYANVPLAESWAPMWMPLDPSLASESDALIARRYAQDRQFTVTADGMSLAAYEQPCREAAASARAMLAQAAGEQWNVPAEECQAQAGFITHGEKKLRFGELAQAAAKLDPPDPAPVRPAPYSEEPLPPERRAEGGGESKYSRLDYPSKVDGSYLFAGDVRLPDMVYAAIKHGPHDKTEVERFDPEPAKQVRGYVGAVNGKRWLAAAATNWWAAQKALAAMEPRFNVDLLVDSQSIENQIDEGIRKGPAYRLETRGEGYDNSPNSDMTMRYEFEPALHAPIETASATARFEDGKLELWVAAQAPEAARSAAAKALGIGTDATVLYPMPAGGSFDCRLEHGHAVEAALIAREMGRPVQLVWSRWQEILHSRPRPPATVLVSVRMSRSNRGMVTGLNTRLSTPPFQREFGERLFGNKTTWAAIRDSKGKPDRLAIAGAMPPYAIPDVSIDHAPIEIGLPAGRMRGNGHVFSAFATECMIDEVAHTHAREPLSYRIALLGDDLRLVECLQRAARMAGWDGGAPGSGQGIACHRMGTAEAGGRIACVAFARPGEGGVRVNRLVAAVDIGRIVNLDIAKQQIEGGLIYGLSQAMGASTTYNSGIPEAQRLAALNLPNLADCPQIEVELIASDAAPFDPGELGAVVAPPAIANALFSATGLRLRRLPLLSGGL